jgi:hypothetical protein|tara:strand:+ start:629 stop:1681 length:1053 start_codon:yes stop_codon:yes gene_type:complete
MRNIIQILPGYKPNIEAVAANAEILGKYLLVKKIKSRFLISDRDPSTHNHELFGSKSSKLLDLLGKHKITDVILHFSGYGYATRGLCFSLLKSLKKWKEKNKAHRLIVIFHDVYAVGPIYRSAFWTCLPQIYIATNLLKLSDCAITSSRYYQSKLLSWIPNKKILLSPIYSNIREIKYNRKLNKRKKIAVIFGGVYQKKVLYADMLSNKKNYLSALSSLSVKQIVDIGPKVIGLKKIGHIPIKSIGIKSKNFISKLLSGAKAGLTFYAVHLMTKSGVVASYASHGVLIVNFYKTNILKTNEFISGVNFVSNVDEKKKLNYQKIANRAEKLYKNNSPIKLALLISRFIKKV